jgi:hypothetical protein
VHQRLLSLNRSVPLCRIDGIVAPVKTISFIDSQNCPSSVGTFFGHGKPIMQDAAAIIGTDRHPME